jgi:hypothetical protein
VTPPSPIDDSPTTARRALRPGPAPGLRPARIPAAALAVLALLALVPRGAWAKPVFAAEDTIPVPSALLPVYEVRADRVTLDEILRRVAEGEARRDSLMKDQSFLLLASMTYLDANGKPARDAQRKWEYAAQVYRKQPDKVREVPLRTVSRLKDGGDDVQVNVGANMREQLVSFAFEPRTRAGFNYSILERHLLAGHVVYVIGFTPRSRVDALPSGKAWIDTNDFVIVRQEFWYRDVSPAPLFLKSIDSCVLERTKVDDQWWVLSRLVARVQMTSMSRFLAKVSRSELAPTVDFAVQFRDWRINQGIDDSVFELLRKP